MNVCNVRGCPEKRRCADVDTPTHCALYRMQNRDKCTPIVVDNKHTYSTLKEAAIAAHVSYKEVYLCLQGTLPNANGHTFKYKRGRYSR